MGELPAGWCVRPLESLVEPNSLTYGIVQPGAHTEGGIPVLRVKDLAGGRIDTTDLLCVDPAIESAYERSRLKPGDIVMSLVGSVGSVGVVPEELDGANLARAVALIRPLAGVGAHWLRLVLSGSDAQAFVHERVNTTVQTTLNLRDLKLIPIVLPPEAERVAIADVLGALDDKIESNRRVASLTDDLVRQEVRAATASADLTVTLADLADLVREQIRPDSLDAATTYIALEHMPRGRMIIDDWASAENLGSNKTRFRKGDVLFGKLRPYFRKVGIAPPQGGVCSTDILPLRPKSPELGPLLLATCASQEFIDFATAGATGTRMPRATWSHMATFQIRRPPNATVSALQESLGPMIEFAQRKIEESQTLAALRDTLLPELLSGRLRVPEAEDLVADAV